MKNVSARLSTVVRVQVPHETFPDVVGEVGRRPAFREELGDQERIAEAQKTNFGTKDEGGAGCVCAVQ